MLARLMSIRVKASFGLVLLTLFIVVIGWLNYQALARLQQNTDLYAEILMPAEGVVLNADRDLYQALTAQQEYLMVQGKGENAAGFRKDFDENVQQAKERMDKFIQLMGDYPDLVSQLSTFERQFGDWSNSAQQVFALVDQGKLDEAKSMHDTLGAKFSQLRGLYNLAGEQDEKLANELKVVSNEVADSRQLWTLILSAIAVVVGLVLSYIGPKLIADSVLAVNDKVDDIARGEGDLVSRLPVTSHDELGKLSRSVNRLLEKLQVLVKQLFGDVDVLSHSTSSLRDIAGRVDSISESQRAQLASLVTAFHEINQAIHDISNHAQLTSDQTHAAQSCADKGMGLLNRNVEMNQQLSSSIQDAASMVARLADESEKITSVLDVIRGIAEQTNLLALNAAIEAARAGEQGRGFAVVADEVRTLASRTQRSTEDIQQMIASLKQGVQSAVQAMERGSNQMGETLGMAAQTRDALSEIQQMVSKVMDMNFQIASATEEQSSVMDEVNRNVSELNSLTEEGAALSASVMTAGHELDQVAQQLSGRVRQFKV